VKQQLLAALGRGHGPEHTGGIGVVVCLLWPVGLEKRFAVLCGGQASSRSVSARKYFNRPAASIRSAGVQFSKQSSQ
jgi:hypothetical protein